MAATDAVLIVGMQQDITDDFKYETAKMEAFLVEAGTAVEIYATTLHYAPCSANEGGFKVGIVLPAGTNYPLEESHEGWEDSFQLIVMTVAVAHLDRQFAVSSSL